MEARKTKNPQPARVRGGEVGNTHSNTEPQVVKQVADSDKLTDSGNAERFAEQHRHAVRYVAAWRQWLVWDGRRWKIDATAEVEALTKSTVRSIYKEAGDTAGLKERMAIVAHAKRSESTASRLNMLRLAQSEKQLAIEPDAYTEPVAPQLPERDARSKERGATAESMAA